MSTNEGFEIVDAHQHIGGLADVLSYSATNPMSYGGDGRGPEATVEDDAAHRVSRMDELGVAWAVLQPSHGYPKPDGIADTMRLNDRMARYLTAAPGRFRVLGTTEPTHGERGLAEVDRVATELGLHGLSWHHRFQGCYIDSKWMWPTLERMGPLGLVPLFHVNAESSLEAHWRLQRLAGDFPDLTFLAMDGTWSYERARHIQTTAGLTPNIIWDIGGQANYVSVQEWVAENGSTTICYSGGGAGTALLAQIEHAAISDEDRANILGGNVSRAFAQARSRRAGS
jgi:predicted TIM-barrel fold metal-dependent hydrolase